MPEARELCMESIAVLFPFFSSDSVLSFFFVICGGTLVFSKYFMSSKHNYYKHNNVKPKIFFLKSFSGSENNIFYFPKICSKCFYCSQK
jgi:hypothetical protein